MSADVLTNLSLRYIHYSNPRRSVTMEADETAADMPITSTTDTGTLRRHTLNESGSKPKPMSDWMKEDTTIWISLHQKIDNFLKDRASTSLDLSFLPLDKTCSKYITKALIKRGETESLILRACLTPGLLSQLCLQFEKEPSKKTLTIDRVDVSTNPNIGIAGATSLGTLLKMWNTKYLDLSECPLQNLEIDHLKKCLKDDFQLTTLVYNSNKISSETMKSLCHLVFSISVLELRIGNCSLNEELLSIMERHIQEAKVKTLDLSYNRMMSQEAYVIIGRIVRKSKIDTVLFVDCKMKYGDLISFQRGLDGNSIAMLDLSYNVEVLNSEEISESPTLRPIRTTRLRLSGCKLDGSVLRKVASEIKLDSLDVTDNPELCEFPQIIMKVITEFGTKLEISAYGWSSDEISQLKSMDTQSGGGIKIRN